MKERQSLCKKERKNKDWESIKFIIKRECVFRKKKDLWWIKMRL